MKKNLYSLTLSDEVVREVDALAHRLGINSIKSELEDLSFKYIDPEAFHDIAQKVGMRRVEREENIRMMREKGFVVWLCRPLEDMIADVRQDTRPNLAGDKAERMRTLYGRRERLYAAAAHLSFDNRMPPEESAKALQKLLTE